MGTHNIALTHYAGRAGDRNDRAMIASHLLAGALSVRLGAFAYAIGSRRPAAAQPWDVELELARADLIAMSRRYESVFGQGARPVSVMGRCAVALATLPVVAAHRPDAVVVWFDAHADVNTPESTTSDYLGGLALSGPLGMWDSGLGSGLAADKAILVGVRDVDPPERGTIESSGLTEVAPGPDLARRVVSAVKGRPVYVHIDCDVLEPGAVPTEYRVSGGLTLAELREAAEALAEGEVVGLEIGEFESETGEEDFVSLLDALAPLLG